MSRYEFKLPDIGEGVAEGEIVEWHVQAGDQITEDQPLVEVMTDKATVTIASPRTGRIVELAGKAGTVVKVHGTLVVYELGEGAASTAAPAKKRDEGPAATAVGDIKDVLPGMGAMVQTAANVDALRGGPAATNVLSLEQFRHEIVPPARPSDDHDDGSRGRALATPATRKLARDLGVELGRVRPSGPSGRVTKDDVREYVARAQQRDRSVAAATAPRAPEASESSAPEVRAPRPAATQGDPALEERTAFRGLRRKIAERMHQSKNTAAHFTFVEECDCTNLKALRERLKPKAEAQGVKLSFLPFITKAVVAALKKHPTLNSTLDEAAGELVVKRYYNIGIATATEHGLVVPVVKRAETRSLVGIAREIDRVSTAARSGRSAIEDVTGSTFTITSLGAQGGLFATPIINFPEVAILGVHQMKPKPVVRDGQIVVGDVMLLSLSFDHRIIDGHIGAAFAYEIIRYLEDPELLLLDL